MTDAGSPRQHVSNLKTHLAWHLRHRAKGSVTRWTLQEPRHGVSGSVEATAGPLLGSRPGRALMPRQTRCAATP
eukprot:10796276-Alexandrium_andersonii.AAC.1